MYTLYVLQYYIVTTGTVGSIVFLIYCYSEEFILYNIVFPTV